MRNKYLYLSVYSAIKVEDTRGFRDAYRVKCLEVVASGQGGWYWIVEYFCPMANTCSRGDSQH
jgi:hypothetical protein